MVRNNKELSLIDDVVTKQICYAKRRNGLLKKALELFTVGGVDCVFISFSPSGQLSFFCGDKRVEDIMARIVGFPDHIRREFLSDNELQEFCAILSDIKNETEEELRKDSTFMALQLEIAKVKAEIEIVEADLRIYDPSPDSIKTIEEANTCEAALLEALAKVEERMKELTENQGHDASQASFPIDNFNGPTIGAVSNGSNNANDSGKSQERTNCEDIIMESNPAQSPLSDIDDPNSWLNGMSFTSLLMSTDLPHHIYSETSETVHNTPMTPSGCPELSNHETLQLNTRHFRSGTSQVYSSENRISEGSNNEDNNNQKKSKQ